MVPSLAEDRCDPVDVLESLNFPEIFPVTGIDSCQKESPRVSIGTTSVSPYSSGEEAYLLDSKCLDNRSSATDTSAGCRPYRRRPGRRLRTGHIHHPRLLLGRRCHARLRMTARTSSRDELAMPEFFSGLRVRPGHGAGRPSNPMRIQCILAPGNDRRRNAPAGISACRECSCLVPRSKNAFFLGNAGRIRPTELGPIACGGGNQISSAEYHRYDPLVHCELQGFERILRRITVSVVRGHLCRLKTPHSLTLSIKI